MADNAGDNGGEWMLIMTDADRKRAKKTDLLLPGRTPATNTSLHGNPSSSGWETRAKKTAIPLSKKTHTTVLNSNPSSRGWETLPKKSSVPFPTCRMTTKNNDPSPIGTKEWETLVTKHRELNDLLGAFDDLPEYPDEIEFASLVNRMYDFHHGPLPQKKSDMEDLSCVSESDDNDDNDESDSDDETEGAPISYKKGFIGEKVASVVVCTIDLQLQPKEGSYSIDEHRIMHLNVPSFEVCNPKKPSKVEKPNLVGGPCPGFVLQPLPGRPSVPCPYGILCRNTANSRWNKSQWLKCHGCTALQNNLSLNLTHHDKKYNSENYLKVILSNISARMKLVSILLTRLLFVL